MADPVQSGGDGNNGSPALQNRACSTILPRKRRRLIARQATVFNKRPVVERDIKIRDLTPFGCAQMY